jgi:hypothetical protein
MFTHIVGGACGLMGLKGSTGVGRFLQASRTTNSDCLLGRLLRSLLRFHCWINLLGRRLVDDKSISDRGLSSKSLRVLLVTEKKTKKIKSSIKVDNKKLNI